MTLGVLGVEPESDTARHRAVLDAFSQVTTEAITSASLQDLLDLVGRQLCAVLGVTRCSAFLLRRGDGRFQGIAGHAACGDITPAITKLVAGTSEDALTREAVARRAPVLAADAQHDPRPVRRAMRQWRVRGLLAVPLVFDGEVIGMLYVDDEDGEHVWTDADVELAALFGRLAALFVRQAQRGTRLASQARQLARQKGLLEHMGDLHAQLTRAVLEGADIAAVVALIGELAGKPVILFDAALEVRAWAAPPALGLDRPPGLPDHVRSLPAVRATIDGLDVDRPSATIPAQLAVGLSHRHLLCVLVVEGRRCGYLDIVEMGGLLGPLDTKLAEHGATVLSLQVLCEQRQSEAEGQARDDFLADLLRGVREPRPLERRAHRIGVDVTQPHVLVRVATPDDAAQLPASARRAAVLRAAAEVLGPDEPPAVSVPGAVILLLRLPGGAGTAALRRLHVGVEAVVDAVRGPAGVRRAVVSDVCRGVGDFPPAYREIRELDELAAAFGRSDGVLRADELGVLRLVVDSDRVAGAVRFAEQVVGPLRRSDAAGGGDLVATLRAYLSTGAQVRATAQALEVHENTVRYRLGRIAEVSGTDPRRFDALLSAQLAFQVLDLVGGEPPGGVR